MAFLAPLAVAGKASALGTGLKIGASVGGLTAPTAVGLKSLGATLAPKLGGAGSSLLTGGGSLLGGGGGSLLTGGSGALLGGGLPAGFGGVGLKAGVGSLVPTSATVPGLVSAAPGVTSAAAPGLFNTMGMSPLGGLQSLVPSATTAGQSAAIQAAKGNIIGAGTQAQMNAAQQLAMQNLKRDIVGSGTQSLMNKAAANANLANMNASILNAANQNVAGGIGLTSPGMAAAPAPFTPASPIIKGQNFLQNAGNFFKDPSVDAAIDYAKEHPMATATGAYGAYQMLKPKEGKPPEGSPGMIRPYEFSREVRPGVFDVDSPIYSATPGSSAEQLYFNDTFTAQQPYFAPGPEYKKKAAEGGVMGLAVGGPVETMSAMNAVGGNMQYPQAGLQTALYSNPMMQRPEPVNVISPSGDAGVGAYSGERKFAMGGLSDLGGYSDGGRLLKGPGDGVSDSIPAVIGGRQPARLADGEFVVPARIVSEIGNGSTEAGARKLYAMMDRVQKARRKTVGKGKVAANTKADKYLPA